MHKRAEPRFQVNSPAKVVRLDDREKELASSILDISAAGLRFLASERLMPGEIVVVVTEHHLILSEVRNCEPRGSGFAVGASRLRALETVELSADATLRENIQVLLGESERGPDVSSATVESVNDQTGANPDPDSAEPLEFLAPVVRPVMPRPPAPTARHFSEIGVR